MTDATILRTDRLTRRFTSRRVLRRRPEYDVLAVDQISLEVRRGQTLGVVGESGSGKTTLARMVVGLITPTSGRVLLDGVDTARMRAATLHRNVQYVFQDPFSSLNPRYTIGRSIEVPLRYLLGQDRATRRQSVTDLLEQTGLRPELATRYPHELSGGQRQRVVIARAIATRPDVVVLDEPVSSLDVSVQAQILTLLRRLQQQSGLTYLFISHDLAVVESLSHDVLVMQRGVVAEQGSRQQIFNSPEHAYTRQLLAAVPGAGPRRSASTSTGVIR